MRWRRTRAQSADVIARDPLVLSVTEPVTRETAAGIAAQVRRIATGNQVVIDLTAIPAFDTDGAAELVGLQESLGPDRLTIVGLGQATARLVGSEDLTLTEPPEQLTTWAVQRLRAIAVVHPVGEAPVSTEGMEAALTAAFDAGLDIVVLDLRHTTLTRSGVESIAFASSTAAVRGQQLLVVNVDPGSEVQLRGTGLSATTYLAPEPFGI